MSSLLKKLPSDELHHTQTVEEKSDMEKTSAAAETQDACAMSVYPERALEPQQGEDIVSSLLQFGNHAWHFDNSVVDVYRAHSFQRDHGKLLPSPQQSCFPQYFASSAYLPFMERNIFMLQIYLPQTVHLRTHRRFIWIAVNAELSTASDVIQQCGVCIESESASVSSSSSAVRAVQQPPVFLLKVVGEESYLYGTHKMFDYEAVRNSLRKHSETEFALVKQEDFKQRVQAARRIQEQYRQQRKSAYPARIVSDVDTLLETTNTIALSESTFPYRLKIAALRNATKLPRFEATRMQSIHVVGELWMGETMIEDATLSTPRFVPSNDIRCTQWLETSGYRRIADLPREAVLCLMVMAVVASGDNWPYDNEEKQEHDECLAWCRVPLIDDQHKLRTGPYLLNMWKVPLFKRTKSGPKTDPFKHSAFRYRGVCRHKNVKQVAADQCQLLLEFDQFEFDVLAPKHCVPLQLPPLKNDGDKFTSASQLSNKVKRAINNIILWKTPLQSLAVDEKQLIWQSRDLLWHDPAALPAFLKSVNWTSLPHITIFDWV